MNAKRTKLAYLLNIIAVILVFVIMQTMIASGTIGRYWQGVLVVVCINIVLAVSLNLTTGVLGQIALGHAGFMSIGAYTAALISKSIADPNMLTYAGALICGGLMAALVGLIVGLPALRLKGDYLAIVTLGFAEIIRVIIEYLNVTGGAQGLRSIPKMTTLPVAFWVMVIVVFFMFTLGRSRQGRAIIAIREDEIAAEASGVNTIYYKTMAFVVAAFFAGIAGGMYGHYVGLLNAKTFGFMKSVEILVFVVLGGMGSFTGSIVAAILLTLLPEFLRQFANYRMLIYSLVLVLMMIFKPTGIFGRYEFSLVQSPRDFVNWVKRKLNKNKKGAEADGNHSKGD